MSELPVQTAAEETRRFLTFKLDSRVYALAANEIAEVIRMPPVARVPQAPKALIGIANLRGTILPIAGLRELLGLQTSNLDAVHAIVLDGLHPAALAVDSIDTFVSVAGGRIDTQQAELAAQSGERVVGTFETTGARTAKILDIKAMLDAVFAERARKKPESMPRAAPGHRTREAKTDREMLVTFAIAGQEYALPLAAIEEIVAAPESVTSIPSTDAPVLGVVALREQLLPILSLRALLGLPPISAQDRPSQKIVVASVGGSTVGLVADQSRAVVGAQRELIDPVPPVLAARSGGETKIKAIYRAENGSRLISILSMEHLFREDVMQRLQAARQGRQDKPESERSDELQFVVFRLGDDEFGLPIEAVEEVARLPEQITRIPKAPKFLEGVVNIRGEILPVIDQRRRFDMPKLESDDGKRLIVVRTERYRAGLIVDSVSEVMRTSSQSIAPPPELTGDITRLIRGVVKREDGIRVCLLLDPKEILSRAERGLLDTVVSKAKASA